MRMMKRCQVEPFTTTLRSVSARTGLRMSTAETVDGVAEGAAKDDTDVDGSRSWINSASLPSVEVEVAAAAARLSRAEERMNVAETDVISRTASVQWGVHGRIACHTEDGHGPAGGVADADVDTDVDVSA